MWGLRFPRKVLQPPFFTKILFFLDAYVNLSWLPIHRLQEIPQVRQVHNLPLHAMQSGVLFDAKKISRWTMCQFLSRGISTKSWEVLSRCSRYGFRNSSPTFCLVLFISSCLAWFRLAHVLFCFALLCFALLCFALLCFVLFCFVLSCLVLSCLVLSCLVSSCLDFINLVLSCLISSCFGLSCLVLSCLAFSCLALFCLVLSCLVLSCLVSSRLAFFRLVSVALLLILTTNLHKELFISC